MTTDDLFLSAMVPSVASVGFAVLAHQHSNGYFDKLLIAASALVCLAAVIMFGTKTGNLDSLFQVPMFILLPITATRYFTFSRRSRWRGLLNAGAANAAAVALVALIVGGDSFYFMILSPLLLIPCAIVAFATRMPRA